MRRIRGGNREKRGREGKGREGRSWEGRRGKRKERSEKERGGEERERWEERERRREDHQFYLNIIVYKRQSRSFYGLKTLFP